MKRALVFSAVVHTVFALSVVMLMQWGAGTARNSMAPIEVDMMKVGEKSAGGAQSPAALSRQTNPPKTPPVSSESAVVPQSQATMPGAAVATPGAGDGSVTISGDGSPRVLSLAEYVAWVRSHNEPPAYPRMSLSLGQQGTAVVRVVLGPEGMPAHSIELATSSGFERLDQVALETVRGWTFPAFTSPLPTVGIVMPFRFQIEAR